MNDNVVEPNKSEKDIEKESRRLYLKKFLISDIIDVSFWMFCNIHRVLDYFFYQVYNTILFRGMCVTAFSLNLRALYYRFLYYPYLTIRYKSPTWKNKKYVYTLGQGKRVHYQSKLPRDEPQRNTFFFWGKDIKPRKLNSRKDRIQQREEARLKKKADVEYAIWICCPFTLTPARRSARKKKTRLQLAMKTN